MKKNSHSQKNKYKVNVHRPLCKYRKSPLLSLKKRSDTVANKEKESQPVNLNSLGLRKSLSFLLCKKDPNQRSARGEKGEDTFNLHCKEKPPFYKVERPSVFKTNSPSSQRKEGVHSQLLHFLKSSSHFGRKSRHLDFAFPWHASMCDKFSGVRNQIPQISGKETLQSLAEAFYCIALVLRKGGKVLVVNKNSEFSPLFRPNSLDAKSPFVIENPSSQNNSKDVHSPLNFPAKSTESIKTMGSQCRPATAPLSWVGGCLTNWKEISKSVATLLYFSKRFGGFIKQNNIHFPRFKKMRNSFQGFIHIEREQLLLKEKPGVLFLFNAHESQQILHEAIALQIPVVALTDSSTDLSQITYPIPINSDSAHLVHRCLSKLMQITNRQGRFSK